MKMTLSKAAEKVIKLSTKVHDYWESELPKRVREYPLIYPDENAGPPPPEQMELRKFVADLPPEIVYQLIGLMQLGRQDFAPADLVNRVEELNHEIVRHDWAMAQLTEKSSLARYVADGIDRLKRSGTDLQKAFTKVSNVVA